MLITHKSTYAASNVIVDTNSVASACNTITFDNYGDDDCKVYINDTAHAHTGAFMMIKAGKSIDLGGSIDSLVNDVFDFVFMNAVASKGVNIIKETYQLLT